MRRRATRAAIFAAVVAAHFLALRFFPDFRPPPEASDREPSIAITYFPAQPRNPQSAIARTLRPASPPHKRERATRAAPSPAAPGAQHQELAPGHPWIDWDKQADSAVADRMERAAEAARRASALSRWREHVMPGPPPRRPEFRWDYAATHRLQTTPFGLVININDRCEIIITLGIFGGCAIGHIPVYGDLFAHMDDPKQPGDSSVP